MHTKPSPCSGTCGWTSPAAHDSYRGPPRWRCPRRGGFGWLWVGCLQMLQGEQFGKAHGGPSCFRLELGEEAAFLRAESTALGVTIMPAAVVCLVESRAERAVRACSAPSAAQVMCPKPHLRVCVGSFLSSAQSLACLLRPSLGWWDWVATKIKGRTKSSGMSNIIKFFC